MSYLGQVDVPIISNTECQQQLSQSMHEPIYNEEDSWVCAGYSEGAKDACEVSYNSSIINIHRGFIRNHEN